jgi:hypothetical protein
MAMGVELVKVCGMSEDAAAGRLPASEESVNDGPD